MVNLMITNLDEVATQTGFASLVGVSQQAISKRVDAGTLTMGQTYRMWLQVLFEKLSTEAAGRGGDAQGALTAARTEEATASAQLKQLMILEKAGKLVPIDGIEPLLIAMVTAARTELLALPDKLTNELKALYGVEVDAALIEENIHAALAHLATSLPDILAGNVEADGGSVDATAETFDD